MRTMWMLLGVLVAGCGVSQAELDEVTSDTQDEVAELGTRSRTYVVLRRDTRRCVAPLCGGYWAHDVNRATVREVYVSALDFSGSNLLDEAQGTVTGAPDGEVILYGKLGPRESRFDTRTFLVTSAWRGMPGVTAPQGELFYSVGDSGIRCITTPCPSLKAKKLHSRSSTIADDLDVSRAAKPLVDQNWLVNRVINGGALVSARIVSQKGRGTVIDASNVFVKLPDMTQSCGRPSIQQCPAGQTNTWVRDANRCLMPAGCVEGGACAAYVPSCEAGYQLFSYTGGRFACTQYACDPEFLFN